MSFTFFTDRLGGFSQGDFSSLNLALHVGDDPGSSFAKSRIISAKYGPTHVHESSTWQCRCELIDPSTGQSPTCDALVTTTPGITLAVLVADCIPLLLNLSEKPWCRSSCW